MTLPSNIKTHCNKCGGIKNHLVLFCKEVFEEDQENGFYESNIYSTVSCLGCESVSFLIITDACYTDGTVQCNYPSAVFRKKPRWFSIFNVPVDVNLRHVKRLIDEIYSAIQNDAPCLAVLGVRSLIEFVMIMKCGDLGSFSKNLDEFHSGGHISTYQKEKLMHLIHIGHAVTHRGFTLKNEDVILLVDILENIMESIFANGDVQWLAQKVPKRTLRKTAQQIDASEPASPAR